MLTNAELDEIRLGLRDGLRGPILLKWCRLLLAERDELTTRLQAAEDALASCTCGARRGRLGQIVASPQIR